MANILMLLGMEEIDKVYNDKHYTNKKISKKEIKDYLLEWEIIINA